MTKDTAKTLHSKEDFLARSKEYDPENKNSPLRAWEEPFYPDELNAPDIKASTLPGWMGAFAGAVANSVLVPEGAPVLQTLACLATCLQKKFVVHCKDDHYETLSMWTFSALDSGARKSAIVGIYTAPIVEWERRRKIDMSFDIAKTETRRNVTKKHIDVLEVQAGKEEEEIRRLELITGITTLKESMPEEQITPCLWTGDVTPETLQNMMVKHDEKMSILSDEGGIFQIMGGLYSAGKANIDIFMQGYTGSPVRAYRSNRTAEMDNPALTFGLIVQPSILEDFCRGGKQRFKDMGIMGRFLYFIPVSIVGHRDLKSAVPIPREIKDSFRRNIQRLLDIEILPDDEGKKDPKVLRLSREALRSWEKFAQNIENSQGEGRPLWDIQTWTAKLAGNALRIAGLLHVGMNNDERTEISNENMEIALDLCEDSIPHAQVAYNKTGSVQSLEDAKVIYRWICTLKKDYFSQRECQHQFRGRFKTRDRMIPALTILKGWSIIGEEAQKETGGRPSTVHSINPTIRRKRKTDGSSKS